jgi:hypothetical protein
MLEPGCIHSIEIYLTHQITKHQNNEEKMHFIHVSLTKLNPPKLLFTIMKMKTQKTMNPLHQPPNPLHSPAQISNATPFSTSHPPTGAPGRYPNSATT